MANIEYKIFFDDKAATQEQLDKVEEIKVEQEVDLAWEARIQIPVCVNEDGKWEGEEEAWMRPFKRVRVEVSMGDDNFVPLIDGPIVGTDGERSALPGKSVVTLVVHDDSAYLNLQDELARFRDKTDSQIARQIFSETQQLSSSSPDIPEETPSQPDPLSPEQMQSGTKIQILRALARRHGDWHAYVRPGAEPGKSIGAFRKFPTEPDGLPPMILLGEDRNISNLTIRNNETRPASVTASTLSITDKSVTSATTSFRDAQLMGDEPAAGTTQPRTERLRPGQNESVSLESATRGAAALKGYASEATGSVIPHCYTGVLSPYRVVLVKISDSKFSVKYLITKVTHTLTRNTYTQAFAMKGNAVSASSGGSAGAPAASANLQVSFNMQVSIF